MIFARSMEHSLISFVFVNCCHHNYCPWPGLSPISAIFCALRWCFLTWLIVIFPREQNLCRDKNAKKIVPHLGCHKSQITNLLLRLTNTNEKWECSNVGSIEMGQEWHSFSAHQDLESRGIGIKIWIPEYLVFWLRISTLLSSHFYCSW